LYIATPPTHILDGPFFVTLCTLASSPIFGNDHSLAFAPRGPPAFS
jgi:hypothetical protein